MLITPGKVTRSRTKNAWLAPSLGKRWTELFFLLYSPVWMVWLLVILVPFKFYEV